MAYRILIWFYRLPLIVRCLLASCLLCLYCVLSLWLIHVMALPWWIFVRLAWGDNGPPHPIFKSYVLSTFLGLVLFVSLAMACSFLIRRKPSQSDSSADQLTKMIDATYAYFELLDDSWHPDDVAAVKSARDEMIDDVQGCDHADRELVSLLCTKWRLMRIKPDGEAKLLPDMFIEKVCQTIELSSLLS